MSSIYCIIKIYMTQIRYILHLCSMIYAQQLESNSLSKRKQRNKNVMKKEDRNIVEQVRKILRFYVSV